MSPWLFSIYMDGVVKKVCARTKRNGMNLVGWMVEDRSCVRLCLRMTQH